MASVSRQGPLDPNEPEYYAPRRLRERPEAQRPQGARLEAVTPPISPSFSLDSQLKNAGTVSLLHPEVVREPAGFARETDGRASLFRLAARFAAVAAVVTVAAVLFLLMRPASQPSDSQQSDTASTSSSTSSETTESPKVALPLSGQDDLASKPALAQFKGLLATPPASQPAPQAQSNQLLQEFIQWRQKDNSTGTAH
jgi:hypothetical protein